ncbi:MAG: hypothetical protein WKF84_30170 [Pyrinomonadaceae bacterium]
MPIIVSGDITDHPGVCLIGGDVAAIGVESRDALGGVFQRAALLAEFFLRELGRGDVVHGYHRA